MGPKDGIRIVQRGIGWTELTGDQAVGIPRQSCTTRPRGEELGDPSVFEDVRC